MNKCHSNPEFLLFITLVNAGVFYCILILLNSDRLNAGS